MAIEAAKLFVSIGADTDGAERGIGRVNQQLGAFGVAAGTLAADAIRGLTGQLVGLGQQGIAVATDYQSSLNMFGAVSGATADQMRQVGELSKQLGSDLTLPGTSAGDAAAAMVELAKAGLTVEETMAAAKGTLQLAAAAGVDNATAAQINANALNAFGLAGNQAGRVADLLAGAANASSASMTDLSQGLQQGAFAFAAGGQSIDDLVASLAILTNVGLTGSDAGTALKNAMLRLQAPTDQAAQLMSDLGISVFDANGEMLPFRQILANLQTGLGGLTMEQRNAALNTIFLSDGMKAIIPLLDQGVAGFDEMTGAVTRTGSAADLSAVQMSGLGGAVEGWKSTIETALLTAVEPFLPALEQLVRGATALVANAPIGAWATSAAAGLDQLLVAAQNPQAVFDALIGRAQQLGADLLGVLPGIVDSVRQWGVGAGAEVQAQLPAIVAGFQSWAIAAGAWAVDAIPGLVGNLLSLRNQAIGWALGELPGWIDSLRGWSLALLGWIVNAAPGMLQTFGQATGELIGVIGEHAPDILDALGAWALALLDWVVDAGPELLQEFGGVAGDLLDDIGRALPGIVNALGRWGAALVDWVITSGPGLLRELGSLAAQLLGWVVDRVPSIVGQLGDWAVAFTNWVVPAGSRLIYELGILTGDLLNWLVGQAPSIGQTLSSWGRGFGDWVANEAWPALERSFGTLWTNVTTWIWDRANAIRSDGSIGQAIIDGIWAGLDGGWNWLTDRLGDLVNRLPEAVRKVLGIASPSRVAMELGGYFSEGFGIGVEDGADRYLPQAAERVAGQMNQPLAAMPIATVPLSAGGGAIGGGGLNLTVIVQGSVLSERDLAERLRQQLVEFKRYNGSTGL